MTNGTSLRYRSLVSGIAKLKRLWLPRRLDPTGSYPQRVHDKVVVFRIFAHAEVEHYVEDRVKEVALLHQRRWKTNQEASRVILGLIGYYSGDRKVVSNSKKQAPVLEKVQDIDFYIEKGMNELSHQIIANNGIKEEDILALLTRVGILASDLEQTWLNRMSSWGTERGDFVHRSPSLTSRTLDPASELQAIGEVLAGLKAIDLKLSTF